MFGTSMRIYRILVAGRIAGHLVGCNLGRIHLAAGHHIRPAAGRIGPAGYCSLGRSRGYHMVRTCRRLIAG